MTTQHPLKPFCRKTVWQKLPTEPRRIMTLTCDELQRAGANTAEIERIQAAQAMANFSVSFHVQENAEFNMPSRIAAHIARELPRLRFSEQEEFWVIGFNTKYQPIQSHHISTGTINQTLIHPRDVFSPALAAKYFAICTIHNHPSGDLTPSDADRGVWQRLQTAADLLGIACVDDFIISRRGVYSRAIGSGILAFTD